MGHVDIVRNLYSAFKDRDSQKILTLFDPQITWIQNEGFPGGGGTHVGAESVVNDVFSKFRADWEHWQAIAHRYLDAGDAVVALGEYQGTYRKTGKSMKAAFSHVYWIENARIIRFEQYTDTAVIALAMDHDEA
ncbi:MAG: nuclear transport factor 2 family protein [Leptospirales bacterium]